MATRLSRLMRKKADGDWLGDREAAGTVYEQINALVPARPDPPEGVSLAQLDEDAADRRWREEHPAAITPETKQAGRDEYARLMGRN